ncbi:type II toxin-antitoxin system HicB family antitoxin [Lichenicoccus roseus]|uniref:CopG family transcriptional regulator n=1 Tax=Lichenicoccus roseus TaxID=2683649 RepID=A0A5R9J4Z9_9PROT|nr:type II toxin-antitoxin system HicB family antitoxin [Lichenicoccus roseus]TLU70691.1 CopG family transcriptional regulator [Lichenicoccus roseus]
MTSYPALIRKDASSGVYGVEFPDLPGCVTLGTDLDDARRMASEALALHIQGLVEDADGVPIPSTLKAVAQDPETGNAVAVLIDVPLSVTNAVRIHVTLPNDLIAAIDRVSSNRSRFLAAAARAALREGASDPADASG